MQALIQLLKPQTLKSWHLKSWRMIVPIVALLLVLGVACGTSTAPDTTAPDTTAPDTTAPEVAAVPTSMPEVMTEPAMAEVADITLVVMVGGWGHRFLSAHGTNCHNHYNLIHDFIIRTDANRSPIPGMASAWELSPDGHTWTVTIRDDGVWHDGSKVTGEDLRYSWLQSWGPGAGDVVTSSSAANMAQNVEKIELIAPQVVSITHINIDSSFEGFISDASGACQGMIQPAGDFATMYDSEVMVAYDQNPIGGGVMRLVKQVEDELMAFERHDEYYAEDRKVPFQNLDLRKIGEEATRAAALKAGEADIAPVSLATKDLVISGGGQIVVGKESSYLRVMYIGCGWEEFDLACSDKRVRQALAYAIDKDALRDDLSGGSSVMEAKGWAHPSVKSQPHPREPPTDQRSPA
jgi:ABC-type transport system substrate-binding protein